MTEPPWPGDSGGGDGQFGGTEPLHGVWASYGVTSGSQHPDLWRGTETIAVTKSLPEVPKALTLLPPALPLGNPILLPGVILVPVLSLRKDQDLVPHWPRSPPSSSIPVGVIWSDHPRPPHTHTLQKSSRMHHPRVSYETHVTVCGHPGPSVSLA
jgi:hypothetical protein